MVAYDRECDNPPRQHSRPTAMPPTPPAEDKPYHAKRPHRKSRMGCRNCKTRKVKCDEKKPSCRNCTLRTETCNYPPRSPSSSTSATSRSTIGSAPASSSVSVSDSGSVPAARLPISTPAVSFSALSAGVAAVSPATTSFTQLQRSPPQHSQSGPRRASHDDSTTSDDSAELIIVNEPPFKFGGADEYDMRLLWFYTTETYASFSVEPNKIPFIDNILKSTIPKFAFQSPFLMNCILGLSALHMQSLHLPVPLSKAITYRTKAFAGYRQAIERANPADYPALLVCSLLLTALSSELFRTTHMKRLYIIDWMVVWRGIGLIFDIIPGETLYDSGLEKLFFRPAFNLNEAALHIPSNLLFMVSGIKEGDEDYPHAETYYDTLKFLGGLYAELESGFSPILSLRIITWLTFLPKPYIELVRMHRPRALVILAHYLAFFKLVPNVWWLEGIANRGIQDIVDAVGSEWQAMLQVARATTQLCDRVEIAKLIQGNHAWEPFTGKDSITPSMAMVNDAGEEVAYDKQRGWVPLFHNAASESTSSGSSTPSPRCENLSPPQT